MAPETGLNLIYLVPFKFKEFLAPDIYRDLLANKSISHRFSDSREMEIDTDGIIKSYGFNNTVEI